MSENPVNIEKKDHLTSYVSEMLGVRLFNLPESMRDEMIREAEELSAVGVNSEEDHKDFMYVLLHTRKIAEDISGQELDSEVLAKLSNLVFYNRVARPIDTIFNFYRAIDKGLNEMGIPIKKKAYPLGQSGMLAKTPHNTRKWMKTMHEIYLMVHHGEEYNNAFNYITAEWDVMEKKDFENWMSFYQEDAHEKYKTAGNDDGDASYLQFGGAPVPFAALTSALPKGHSEHSFMPNMERYKQKVEDDEEAQAAEAERLEARDKKVKSIGGRLRSALRLLSDEDVQHTLDGKLDISIADFIKQIQELQRYILLIPLKNKRSSILEDLIIQRGNKLAAQGFPKAGELIKKFAQDVPVPADLPLGEDVGPPPAVEELEGVEPAEDKDVDLESFEDEKDWVQDFKDNINGLKNDKAQVDDLSLTDDFAEITVEAQAIPIEGPQPDMPEEEIAIEVEEEPDMMDPAMDPGMDLGGPEPADDMTSLENVTIEAVVERLERVSNILKNREIPRELAWIDFMLDKLGLASYFPALAEATKSALESNQYMSSRIEDIVSRLRGSIKPENPIELTTTEPEEAATDSTLQQVRQNLEIGEAKNRAKREKKQMGEEEPAPAIPAEEIAQPFELETAPPVPVRPAPVR